MPSPIDDLFEDKSASPVDDLFDTPAEGPPPEKPESPGLLERTWETGKGILNAQFNPVEKARLILGGAEAITAGTAGMAEAAAEGLAGTGTSVLGSIGLAEEGKGTYEYGSTGVRKALSGVMEEAQPVTERGKQLTELLGIIPQGIHKAGEFTYETTGSPVAGAGVEAAGTLASFILPVKGAKALGGLKGRGTKITPEMHPTEVIDKTVPTSVADTNLSEPIKIETPRDLANSLHQTTMAHLADKEESLQFIRNAEKNGVTPEMRMEFRDYSEAIAAGEKPRVTPEFKAKYDEYSGKLQTEITDTMKRMGPDAKSVMDDFSNRIARRAAAWLDSITHYKPDQTVGTMRGGFARIPTSERSRSVFATDAGEIITVKPEAGKYRVTRWENGDSYVLGHSNKPIKVGEEFQGNKIVQAQQKDIELHTPIKYVGDDLMVKTMLLDSLRKTERERNLINQLKNSDFGRSYMMSADTHPDMIPENFRRLSGEAQNAFPAFRDNFMSDKYAEVLEDFAGKYRETGLLDSANNVIIRAMMINPFPHIMNELVHWFDARGASGFISPVALTEASGGLPGLKYIPESFRSVVSQDAFQRQLMREGGYLLYPSIRQQAAFKRVMQLGVKETFKDAVSSREIGKIANALGMPVGKLMLGISDKAATIMWATRDVLYTHLIKEQMGLGKTMPEAIKEVGKHMPEYYLPSRVLGSRKLSRVMQSRALVFSRYHYGLLRALGENIKELTSFRNKGKEFAKGVDHALAIALGAGIIYKGLDAMAQGMLGENEAEQRRAGPYHIMERAYEVVQGEKDYPSLMQSILTPNPALLAAGEVLENREFYSGKTIVAPGSTPSEAALQIARFVSGQLAPVQGIQKRIEDREDTKDWLARQMDIQTNRNRMRQQRARLRAKIRERRKLELLKRQYGIGR